MFKKFLAFFKSKTSEYPEEGIDVATAEFDALMVTVEDDETNLVTLERHLRQEFDEIEKNVKEDCNRVDQAVN